MNGIEVENNYVDNDDDDDNLICPFIAHFKTTEDVTEKNYDCRNAEADVCATESYQPSPILELSIFPPEEKDVLSSNTVDTSEDESLDTNSPVISGSIIVDAPNEAANSSGTFESDPSISAVNERPIANSLNAAAAGTSGSCGFSFLWAAVVGAIGTLLIL